MADKIRIDSAEGCQCIGELFLKHMGDGFFPRNGEKTLSIDRLEIYLKRLKESVRRGWGGTVSITPPPTTPTWTGYVPANFQVNGTDLNQNYVDGTLTDGTHVYTPGGPDDGDPLGTSSPYSWTLNFNNSSAIPSSHKVYLYVFDTVTFDSVPVTITTTARGYAGPSETAHQTAPSFPPVIEVMERTSPDDVQDIPVKVTHPEYTRGLILLFLRKNGHPPRRVVKTHSLEPTSQTRCTFKRIRMECWDSVSVHAVTDAGIAATPVVLKPSQSK